MERLIRFVHLLGSDIWDWAKDCLRPIMVGLILGGEFYLSATLIGWVLSLIGCPIIQLPGQSRLDALTGTGMAALVGLLFAWFILYCTLLLVRWVRAKWEVSQS